MKKQNKKEICIEMYLNSNGSREDYKGLTIVRYISKYNQKNAVAIWKHRGYKPIYNYGFNDVEEMEKWIENEKIVADRDEISLQNDMKKYEERKALIQKGSILFSSWGYEQTNIDFFKVLERKGDFVIIQEIGSRIEKYDHFMSGTKVADESVTIGEPMRKKLTKYGSVNLASYKWTSLWDGKPMRFSTYA